MLEIQVWLPAEVIFFAINLFTDFWYIKIFLKWPIEHQIIKLLTNVICDIIMVVICVSL